MSDELFDQVCNASVSIDAEEAAEACCEIIREGGDYERLVLVFNTLLATAALLADEMNTGVKPDMPYIVQRGTVH